MPNGTKIVMYSLLGMYNNIIYIVMRRSRILNKNV